MTHPSQGDRVAAAGALSLWQFRVNMPFALGAFEENQKQFRAWTMEPEWLCSDLPPSLHLLWDPRQVAFVSLPSSAECKQQHRAHRCSVRVQSLYQNTHGTAVQCHEVSAIGFHLSTKNQVHALPGRYVYNVTMTAACRITGAVGVSQSAKSHFGQRRA